MSKPVILILGATGSIGKATIKHLSAEYGSKVEIRAASRNPSSAPDAIKLPGVKIVKFTFGDDKAQLKDLFTGVDRLFIIPPGMESADPVTEAVTVAKEVGVKHLMLLCGRTSELNPDHKHTILGGSFHFMERKVLELYPQGIVFSVPFFMENNLMFAQSVKETGKFSYPTDPDGKVPWMAVDDAGKCAARILSDPEKHHGNYYRLINDLKSYRELAAFLSEAVGKPVEYEHISYEQFEEGMAKFGAPKYVIETSIKASRMIDEKTEVMVYPETQDHHNITGHHPVLLKQWCVQHAEQFKGN